MYIKRGRALINQLFLACLNHYTLIQMCIWRDGSMQFWTVPV